MKVKNYFLALLALTALSACQSESPQENSTPRRVFTVLASLPDSQTTRTHIIYGDTAKDKETFRWHPITDVYDDNDFISVSNVTRLSEFRYSVELNCVEVNGNTAKFESTETVDPSFKIKAGDILFINYYNTEINRTSDNQDVFTLYVGTEANKPQYIVDNPADSMEYMQGNLRMYDIVTAVEDDKIPDIHFRHLSAIIRVSLRNETGHDIYPTKLECIYPGTESIFRTTLYCTVDTESTDGSGLKVYENYEFFKGSKVYTDSIGTTVNGKDGTTDIGGSIAPGTTYDLYLSTVPRIANNIKGDKLKINLIQGHDTKHPYSITLDGFNTPIEAGKRYWFNLTATEEQDTIRKLVFTSEWLEQHKDAEKIYE